MNIINRLSPRQIVKTLVSSTKRFPIAIAFAALLTVSVIFLNHTGSQSLDGDTAFFITYWPATAAMLSLSLALWAEELKPHRRLLSVLVQTGIHIAWLAGACYTSFGPLTPMRVGAAIAANTAVVMSTVLMPFWRERNDLALWNFTLRMTIAVAVSWVISSILAVAVALLISSIERLFGFSINEKIYTDFFTICECMIAPLLLAQLVPHGESKHDRTPVLLTGFGKGVVNYLLLPVTGAYAITLYAYAVKIIMQWQLPNGWVSYLVTAFAAMMLMVVAVLYPSVLTGNCSRLHKAASRWLPAMVLPMLMLMTVGVARRIGDYGITINRLYLAVFNAWLYLVCIGLIIKRKRIWWVPASFALLLIITSIGPQSISNITRITLKRQIAETMTQAGVTSMPIDNKQYEQLLKRLPANQAKCLDSRLKYLCFNYARTEAKEIINYDVRIGLFTDNISSDPMFQSQTADNMLSTASMLPQGYKYVTHITGSRTAMSKNKAELTLDGNNGQQVKFVVTYEQVQKACEDSKQKLTLKSQNALLMVDNIQYFDSDNSLYIDGLLLEK